jgi:hypothetical protein
VAFRTIDGARIRYTDSGGPQEPTVLLTSPWSESPSQRAGTIMNPAEAASPAGDPLTKTQSRQLREIGRRIMRAIDPDDRRPDGS